MTSNWVVVRIGAAPNANWLIQLVADQGIRTAPGDHSWRLIRKMLSRVDHLGLESDLMTDMLTVLDLANFPCAEGHSTSKVMMLV